MINRKRFYDSIRKSLFGNLISKSQLEGLETILNEWELWVLNKWTGEDFRKLAYIFATTFHETAATIQPIKEYGVDKYFVKMYWTNQKKAKELGNKSRQDAIDYCGKGFVQITGRYNYAKMSKLLNKDLVNNPNLAMTVSVASEIIFEGMLTGKSFAGDFTGKSLTNYFNKTTNDPINARRIINGTDRAKLIASYHSKFLAALS